MLEGAIRDGINQRIGEIIDEEVQKTKDIVVARVRESVGEIAAKVLTYMDMQYRDNRLIITVNFKKDL